MQLTPAAAPLPAAVRRLAEHLLVLMNLRRFLQVPELVFLTTARRLTAFSMDCMDLCIGALRWFQLHCVSHVALRQSLHGRRQERLTAMLGCGLWVQA